MTIKNFNIFLNENNKKLRNYWTKERCHKEALKYNSKKEYRNNCTSYLAAKRNGWIDEICSHMISPYKSLSYWTFEKCKKEALKYNNRRNFERKSSSAYHAAKINGWFNDICSHMIQFRSEYFGYAYEFDDNYVYIGITSRENKRHSRHMKDELSSVFKHMKLTGLNPKKVELFSPTNPEEASKLEGKWLEYYKDNGWNILNISKTGSLGGTIIKWTKEKCREEALKYNTRKDFKMNSNSAYCSAWKNKWLNEICLHMIKPPSHAYWTYNRCKEESLKYKTSGQLRNNNSGAYNSILRNKWLDEFFPNTTHRNRK